MPPFTLVNGGSGSLRFFANVRFVDVACTVFIIIGALIGMMS